MLSFGCSTRGCGDTGLLWSLKAPLQALKRQKRWSPGRLSRYPAFWAAAWRRGQTRSQRRDGEARFERCGGGEGRIGNAGGREGPRPHPAKGPGRAPLCPCGTCGRCAALRCACRHRPRGGAAGARGRSHPAAGGRAVPPPQRLGAQRARGGPGTERSCLTEGELRPTPVRLRKQRHHEKGLPAHA